MRRLRSDYNTTIDRALYLPRCHSFLGRRSDGFALKKLVAEVVISAGVQSVVAAIVRLLLAFDGLIGETGEVVVYRTGLEVVRVVVVDPGAPRFDGTQVR